MKKTFFLKSENESIKFAKSVAPFIKVGDVIALYGELGAGKTFFSNELCKSFGVTDSVSSPSYVLMNEYQAKDFIISHFDLFRLGSEEEVLELGIPDIFEDRITLIEWPDLAEYFLPQNTIKIYFEYDGESRKVTIDSDFSPDISL